MGEPTTTIRIRTDTRDRLKSVASAVGASTADLVDSWARAADEDLLLDATSSAWEGMTGAELAAYRDESDELAGFTADLPRY